MNEAQGEITSGVGAAMLEPDAEDRTAGEVEPAAADPSAPAEARGRTGRMNEPTPERLREVSEQAREIFRSRLSEPASRTRFAGDVQRTEVDQPPLVLVIGNHSSGKSSFINMLLGEEVQRTAQAPMDDGFTLLSRGDESAEFDGQKKIKE